MQRLLLVSVCALLTGCVAVNGDPLTMTFNSDVSAGEAYRITDGKALGALPVKVQYDMKNTSFDARGCFLVSGIIVEWQSGYANSSPEVISLCAGPRHYDYHIPYTNADEQSRAEDVRFAYRRVNSLPGSAAGAIPYTPQPALSQHPSTLENMLGAIAIASMLADISDELHAATRQNPHHPSRINIGGTCSGDRDCTIGQRCTKPIHSPKGICVQPMDEHELRELFTPGTIELDAQIRCSDQQEDQDSGELLPESISPCPSLE